VAHDVAFAGDPDELRTEIKRATARLLELSLARRAALDDLERRMAKSDADLASQFEPCDADGKPDPDGALPLRFGWGYAVC
jgi:hypothetical protein